MSRKDLRFGVAVLGIAAAATAMAQSGAPTAKTISWTGRERVYWFSCPAAGTSQASLPLVLVLHGSGQGAETLVSKWKSLSETEHFAVAGPAALDSTRWTSPADGPAFLHAVVEDLKAQCPLDGRRVFLFGHSAGAVFALEMAALESEYFAAAAIHAGALPRESVDIFGHASRKIPFLILIGTRDAYFPLDLVTATREALLARGFPVEYVEMQGHTHEYAGSADEINRKVWDFFSTKRLAGEPHYTAYRETR